MNPIFVDEFERERLNRSIQQNKDKKGSGDNKKAKINQEGISSADEFPGWSLLNQQYLVEQINKVKLYLMNYCMSGSKYLKDSGNNEILIQYDSEENITGQSGKNNKNHQGSETLDKDKYFTNKSETEKNPKKLDSNIDGVQNKESKSTIRQQERNSMYVYDNIRIYDHYTNKDSNDNDLYTKMPFVSALDHLCDVFNLTEFERYILILCAAIELDSSFGKLCSRINGDKIDVDTIDNCDTLNDNINDNKANQTNINLDSMDSHTDKDNQKEQGTVFDSNASFSYSNINTVSNYAAIINSCPNFAMALSVLPESHWSAISPRSTIREYGLIDIDNENFKHFPVVMRPIKISERVLHYLTGVFYVDRVLENISNSFKGFSPSGPQLSSDHPDNFDRKQILSENFADYYIKTDSYSNIISTAVNLFKDLSPPFPSVLRKTKDYRSSSYVPPHTDKKYVRYPVVQLIGPDDVSKLDICRIIFSNTGYRFVAIPATSIPDKLEAQRDLLDILTRESLLMDLGYYVYFTEDMDEGTRNNLARFLDNSNNPINLPLIVGIKEENRRLKLANVQTVYLNISKPSKDEQSRLWVELLHKKNRELHEKILKEYPQQPQPQMISKKKSRYGKTSKNKNTVGFEQDIFYSNQNFVDSTRLIDQMVEYYDLSTYDIKSAVDQTYYSLYRNMTFEEKDTKSLYVLYNEITQNFESILRSSVKTLIQDKFPGFVERVNSDTTLDDLVLSQREKDHLKNIMVHIKHRSKVYGEWGFGSKTNRGSNNIALFYGQSGTGKSMAAESIANALELDLYRTDLSSVVSKYIGETEKNLSKVFAAAENGGCILFFDEADALFGKRTAIKDSHDRYANIEINYLLQKLESNNNIVLTILATNMKESMDDAFLRRIKFFANFPFPGYESRVKIWENIFPKKIPLYNLDFSLLGKLNLTGGQIRNIAEDATFLAADEGVPLHMEHLRIATQNEYLKTGTMITNDIWKG